MHMHLDCQFGIAGDMLLAALIDAGADAEAVAAALRAIPLDGFRLSCGRVSRGGVAAMRADVEDTTGAGQEDGHAHDNEPHHSHDHEPHHAGSHHHGHDHDHGHRHHHAPASPHRHLADLLRLLDAPGLSPAVKERAGRVFRIIAEAEAAVHGATPETVHFHEISGIDTAVDVIGTCLALDMLGVETVTASPVAVGSGMVMCEHGIFPVPAPATLEILKTRGIPWQSGGEGERATPTGVGLLAGLADSFGPAPEITVTRIGYGAGRREFVDAPNLLRAIIGKRGRAGRKTGETVVARVVPSGTGELVRVPNGEALLPTAVAAMLPGAVEDGGDRVVEFRLIVDDMTPEAIGYLCERVYSAGAMEAYAVAAVMKKGRPGHEITVLAPLDAAEAVSDALWKDSTTFGMRVGERSRLTLPREMRTVEVLGHEVRVKIGWHCGEIIRRQPEYEDCRAAALATGRSLGEIFARAAQAAEYTDAP